MSLHRAFGIVWLVLAAVNIALLIAGAKPSKTDVVLLSLTQALLGVTYLTI